MPGSGGAYPKAPLVPWTRRKRCNGSSSGSTNLEVETTLCISTQEPTKTGIPSKIWSSTTTPTSTCA
eukprot:8536521-Pyramimonas_sp.AAC.1